MAAKTGTYTLIASNTFTGTTNIVTFSSIPATYTDLVIVANISFTAATETVAIQFNGTGGTAYSSTYITGNGTTATSSRRTSTNAIYDNGNPSLNNSNFNSYIFNIQDYANTTTYKTVLGRYNTIDTQVVAGVSTWANTSAVNQISFQTSSGSNFRSGSTVKIYGIEAGNL